MKRWTNLASIFTRPKPAVGATPSDVVHRENKWRLLRYRSSGAPAYRTPVLLVPSLINRHYVLDLLPGRSMAQDLVAKGHDVYCIDWGTPGDEDRFVTFDDVCDRYLGRAIRAVAKTSPRKQAHVLGYCLGGTLATIHAAANPEHIASLMLLAAPVSFRDEGPLSHWTRSGSFDVGGLVRGTGNVPWQLMQSAFNMIRPTLQVAKLVGLVDRAESDDFLESFLALETWGNDNVSFPGACFQQYIEELYRSDALMKDAFYLSAKPARLASIRCPVTCVVFEQDNIVPWQSAAVLADRVASTDKDVWKLSGGHVGAVVSRGAQKNLWPRLSRFWAERDESAAVALTTVATVATVAPAVAAPAPSVAAAASPPHVIDQPKVAAAAPEAAVVPRKKTAAPAKKRQRTRRASPHTRERPSTARLV